MTGTASDDGPSNDLPVIEARPQKTALIANVCAAIAMIVFIAVALLMKRDNAGAAFGYKDQIFTLIVGVLVAGGLRLPARPRMRADAEAVHLRSYLGNWRTVPWGAVVAVEFPSNARFARLVLPADELFAIYAIQRLDRNYAVQAMRGLRAQFAATHPAPR